MLKIQNNKDKLLTLLFLYNRNMKINLPIIDMDVAVYGKKCKLFESININIVLYINNNIELTNDIELTNGPRSARFTL